MTLTRASVEAMLIRRAGKLLTVAGLDGATKDGTNADLGDPILATAGYNAGPGRAKRWRDAKPLEGAAYAESIPFDETRDYVKKVMANAWFYTHRLTGKTASLRGLMGTVPSRNGNGAANVATLP